MNLVSMTCREQRLGLLYLAFSLVALPPVLSCLGLGAAPLNLVYYILNFAAALVIFRKFLKKELGSIPGRLFPVLWYGILGYLGNQALGELLGLLIQAAAPDYSNANDLSLVRMLQEAPILSWAIVLLVPVAEELFHRALVFRSLLDRSPLLAYAVSMALFAAIHVAGYAFTLPPLHLLLSFLQYLPAGYCLAFVYRRSGSIVTPILTHMLVNAAGLLSLR